ncbi:radical SAM protein [Maridesulfovibrio ferrireducens]|uniref:radical SAM protein n=1 Tax=Maridesulfovibrio ferrireducens TaxID=246191 RepID=UPI001A22A35D|nr:radical SAM protein [Maridesulfovibrio ferrireducens]MBI9112757.1 radical SAM protein [Maridesulfovibrio ferrireducens]
MDSLGFLEVHAVDHCNHNCRWCHNYSPFSPKKEYEAKDYFEGLDVLQKNKVIPQVISIMGGEPFLHSNLTKFAFHLFERYRKRLMITTNGFWLSIEAVKAYDTLWKMISVLKVSRYPTIEKRLGGAEEEKKVVDFIKKTYPHLHVMFPQKAIFNKLEFFEKPVEVKRYCGNSSCIALLPNMKMARCGAGAYAHLAPEGVLPEGFKKCTQMFYDLQNFKPSSFKLWYNLYPLEACSYCSFSENDIQVSWKVEKGRTPFNDDYDFEYFCNLGKAMIIQNNIPAAKQQIRYLFERFGEKAEISVLAGIASINSGNLQEGLSSFAEALELDSDNAEARKFLHQVREQVVQK